jgi:hypothetical protein
LKARPRDNFKLIVALIWVIGLATLFEARVIWPGILFLGGATALVASRYRPEWRNAGRIGTAMLVLGVWATMRFSLPALVFALGTAIIIAAIFRRPPEENPADEFDLD